LADLNLPQWVLGYTSVHGTWEGTALSTASHFWAYPPTGSGRTDLNPYVTFVESLSKRRS